MLLGKILHFISKASEKKAKGLIQSSPLWLMATSMAPLCAGLSLLPRILLPRKGEKDTESTKGTACLESELQTQLHSLETPVC